MQKRIAPHATERHARTHTRAPTERIAMSTEALLAGGGGGGGGGEVKRRVSIDDALAWHAGEFGRWQLRHFVLVSSAWLLEALHTMVIIFADREPAMVCAAGDGRCGDRCAGAGAATGTGWEWASGRASSTVSEWGLVCGERYKVGLVQAIFFAGCMIGQCSNSRPNYLRFQVVFFFDELRNGMPKCKILRLDETLALIVAST